MKTRTIYAVMCKSLDKNRDVNTNMVALYKRKRDARRYTKERNDCVEYESTDGYENEYYVEEKELILKV